METAKKIWMDGKMVDWKNAKVHVLTHTLHYGGGAFEGIRFYKTADGPGIFRLKEHVDRLFFSAKVLQMKKIFTKKEIADAIIKVVKVNNLESGYIRPLIYYGYGKMGLDPRGAPVNVAIAAWSWGAYLGTDPVRTKISPIMRVHPATTVPEAKLCGIYVNSILASLDAHGGKYDEAILLDEKGNVAEGPGENIFMVKKGTIFTPKTGSILPGITRDSIFQIAKDNNLIIKEKIIKPKELFSAEEIFFTGTAAEVSAIGSVDGKKIHKGKMGPITQQLKMLYTDAIHGRTPKYKKWLTLVK